MLYLYLLVFRIVVPSFRKTQIVVVVVVVLCMYFNIAGVFQSTVAVILIDAPSVPSLAGKAVQGSH